MSNEPKVSIIIPVYNGEEYITDALESSLEQTYQEVEVIVVDDGSTDGTPEVLRQYEGRIVHIRQENRGVAAARNAGLAASRGEYICYLDSDDTIDATKVEVQAAALDQHPDAGLCYGIWQKIDSRDGRVLCTSPAIPGNMDRSCRPFPPEFQIAATMIRREWLLKVNGFDETQDRAEDEDLRFRLWAAGCRFWAICDVVSRYTLRADSLSTSDVAKCSVAYLRALEKHFVAMKEEIPLRTQNELRVKTLLKIGAGHLRAGRPRDAEVSWIRALEYQHDFFSQVQAWWGLFHFLDPCYPLEDPQTFPDHACAWNSVCAAVSEIRSRDDARAGTPIRLPRKALLAYALAELASSKGRSWLARFWLARSLAFGQGKLPPGQSWRKAMQIALGPAFTRYTQRLLLSFRRLTSEKACRR